MDIQSSIAQHEAVCRVTYFSYSTPEYARVLGRVLILNQIAKGLQLSSSSPGKPCDIHNLGFGVLDQQTLNELLHTTCGLRRLEPRRFYGLKLEYLWPTLGSELDTKLILSIMTVLVLSGADVNWKPNVACRNEFWLYVEDPIRFSSLAFAICDGKLEEVEFLLKHGADPNELLISWFPITIGCFTCVSLALKYCYHDVRMLQCLIKYGADIKLLDGTGKCYLVQCLHHDSVNCLKVLVDNGADLSGAGPSFLDQIFRSIAHSERTLGELCSYTAEELEIGAAFLLTDLENPDDLGWLISSGLECIRRELACAEYVISTGQSVLPKESWVKEGLRMGAYYTMCSFYRFFVESNIPVAFPEEPFLSEPFAPPLSYPLISNGANCLAEMIRRNQESCSFLRLLENPLTVMRAVHRLPSLQEVCTAKISVLVSASCVVNNQLTRAECISKLPAPALLKRKWMFKDIKEKMEKDVEAFSERSKHLKKICRYFQ